MLRLKDIVPPVLWRSIHRVPELALFPSYEAAEAACAGHGYEAGQLVETVFEKTKIFREAVAKQPVVTVQGPASPPLMTALAALRHERDTIKVLDVGGACGAHYFAARPFLPAEAKVRWIVVETPGMVAKGAELQNDELQFSDNLDNARRDLGVPHLVHSSGTLPFVSRPYEMLQSLLALDARAILLTRLFLTAQNQDSFTVHHSRLRENGPGPLPAGLPDGECRVPCTYLRHDAVETLVRERYEILLRWSQPGRALGTIPVTEYSFWAAQKK